MPTESDLLDARSSDDGHAGRTPESSQLVLVDFKARGHPRQQGQRLPHARLGLVRGTGYLDLHLRRGSDNAYRVRVGKCRVLDKS
jgi:hypothetical protein